MTSVFILEHLHTHDNGEECWKRIGIYHTYEEALAALERSKLLSGFSDHPNLIDPTNDKAINGFTIDEYELGKDHWTEGYVTL